jgi:hypothetical protein
VNGSTIHRQSAVVNHVGCPSAGSHNVGSERTYQSRVLEEALEPARFIIDDALKPTAEENRLA